MNSSFLQNITIRLLIIATISIAIGWLYFATDQLIYPVALTIVLAFRILNLIKYQNKINERINYFFEAIINEDFSQILPNNKGDKTLQKLNQNLTRVNRKFEQIKSQNLEQEQYFRTLIEHVSVGVLTYNQKGFVIHANGCLKKLLGLQQLTHIKQLYKVDQKLANCLQNIQQQEQQLFTITRKDDSINLLVKATTFKNRDEKLTLLSVQDIDQELDEKELDSWLKLIRVLTHEIMNAIAPVTSLSESLSRFFEKDGQPIKANEVDDKMIATTIRGLSIIQEQGKGLISFVESYRKLTRLPKPEKKQIDVRNLLEKALLLSKVNCSSPDLKFNIEQSQKLQLIADEQLLTQVLLNIIKNGCEALAQTSNATITICANKTANGQIEIAIKDNGPGIDQELINEIFVPFFTTREHGSGIGLSLSRQIMRLHSGFLKVKSIPNKETTFTMLFPK